MKKLNKLVKTLTAVGSIVLLSSPFSKADPTLSGSVSFDMNSHFMSYGADVWSAGSDADFLFQPSGGISVDFDSGLSLYTGVWFDINDKADSTIGGKFQEIDVWVGAAYAFDGFTLDVAVQQWYYAGETEGILDVTLSFDAMLSPYVKAHTRFEPVGTQEEGTVLEFGGYYDIDEGDMSMDFGIPFALGYFVEDKYQGGDDSIGYYNVGLSFGMPIEAPESMGSWDFHGGLTLWHTPEDAVPGNPDETFVTFSLGFGLGF